MLDNQKGVIAPIVVIVVGLLFFGFLYYLYISNGSSMTKSNLSQEKQNVMPEEMPGVSYTTE